MSLNQPKVPKNHHDETVASKVTEQENTDDPIWKRSGIRGHKREEHSKTSLFLGWQEIKAIKLRPHLSKLPYV